jgi:hypothetical protein
MPSIEIGSERFRYDPVCESRYFMRKTSLQIGISNANVGLSESNAGSSIWIRMTIF